MKAPKNPLLALLIVLNTGFAIYLLSLQLSYEEKVSSVLSQRQAPVEKKIKSPYLPEAKADHRIAEYPFGNFSINLARPGGPQRFIKLSMTLIIETPIDKDKDLTEIINKTPALRDEIIGIFNTQTPQDILKLEGRAVIKDILLKHINNQLKVDRVVRILFTEFLVS